MSDTKIREASCACGQLKIRLNGDPLYVSSCACQACQRRTGSAFGVTSLFREDQVVGHEGEATTFRRTAESGNDLTFRFCPRCGSTVWWEPHARPGVVAVAGGAFADKDFPAPQRFIWTDFKATWARSADGAAEHPRQPD